MLENKKRIIDNLNTCLGKCKYFTEQKAHKKKKEMFRRRGIKLRVYFCEVCGGWHLTKKIEVK